MTIQNFFEIYILVASVPIVPCYSSPFILTFVFIFVVSESLRLWKTGFL